MIRSICLVSLLFVFIANISIGAQEQEQRSGQRPTSTRTPPEVRRQSLIMEINTRVLSEAQNVRWTQAESRIAIPGNPVAIRMVGTNIIMVLQFTPIIRREGHILVAQSQIWIESPGGDLNYYTSVQTIPMDINEPIHFFPLGTEADPSIEIILTVNTYSRNDN